MQLFLKRLQESNTTDLFMNQEFSVFGQQPEHHLLAYSKPWWQQWLYETFGQAAKEYPLIERYAKHLAQVQQPE